MTLKMDTNKSGPTGKSAFPQAWQAKLTLGIHIELTLADCPDSHMHIMADQAFPTK